MLPHRSTPTLAILLTAAGVATAAPPALRGLPSAASSTQAVGGAASSPEELPVRVKAGKEPAPLREPASPPPSAAKVPAGNSAAAAGVSDAAPAVKEQGPGAAPATTQGCGKPDCAACACQVPTCKPKWEDKKTKKATFTMTCDFECVRRWEPYHQGDCCEEKTTPCGEIHTKKKLFKTEEERVERVLKYEVVMKPASPCCESGAACRCLGCRWLGTAFARMVHGGR